MRAALACAIATLATLASGCSVATHQYKHRYWAQQDGAERLPPADIAGPAGYISYPLLFQRKELFAAVSDNCDEHPLDIRVSTSVRPAMNPLVALPWIIVSGSSVFLIPYKGNFEVAAEFTVSVDGAELKTFRYTDVKTTWLSFFAFATLGEKTDEYYVEELMADQFVNSFILDLHRDEALLAQVRATGAMPAPTLTAEPAVVDPPANP